MGEDMLKYYPEGAHPIVRGEAANTATNGRMRYEGEYLQTVARKPA